MNIVQYINKRAVSGMIKNKKRVTALITLAVLVAGVCLVIKWTERNRAISVFNDAGEDYIQLLREGLPDEQAEESGIKETINSLLGFDTSEPHTIIKSSSSIFNDVEIEEDEGSLLPEEIPEETSVPEDKPSILPTFSQICTASGLTVNNATGYTAEPDVVCAEPLYIKPSYDGPQILIVHTHTTECYDGDNLVGESDRTTDEAKNMIAVGEKIKNVLGEYGIESIHDTTVHDYPTYQGAYTRALSTIEKNLKNYPTIKMVFDIHRDAFIYSDGSKLTLQCETEGITAAKVMIVCGTDSMGLSHPHWRENFKLAAKIQNTAEIMYPGMMRPINLRKERFNMHTTTGSLLFEIGANGNTLEEAIVSGENIGRAIAAVLINQS